jgi:hypothetical protein
MRCPTALFLLLPPRSVLSVQSTVEEKSLGTVLYCTYHSVSTKERSRFRQTEIGKAFIFYEFGEHELDVQKRVVNSVVC